MMALAPLESLFEAIEGDDIPLPPEIANVYGRLQFPTNRARPYVIANFVSTLDGIVAFEDTGKGGGGEISGHFEHDRMVMGIFRAVADAVIAGAGTLRSVPAHFWTAEDIYPRFTDAYRLLRSQRGKSEPPLNVIVTEHGELDLKLPIFASGKVPALIATTEVGAHKMRAQAIQLPRSTQIVPVKREGRLTAHEIQKAVEDARKCELILVEGGPQLMSEYFAGNALDELFLTLAPQVAGRKDDSDRPGIVDGKILAPKQPTWGKLVGVKRAESHLFLRYAFKNKD